MNDQRAAFACRIKATPTLAACVLMLANPTLAHAQCPYDWAMVGKLKGAPPGLLRYLTNEEGTFAYVSCDKVEFDGQEFLHMARWDGEAWSSMANGWPLPALQASELVAFDAGQGRELWAIIGPSMYRWKDATWSIIGPAKPTKLFVIDPDGPGPIGEQLWGIKVPKSQSKTMFRYESGDWTPVPQAGGTANRK